MLSVGTMVQVNTEGKWRKLGPWRIIKVNLTTYKMQNSAGVKLNAPHAMVHEIEGASAFSESDVRPSGLKAGVVVTVDIPLAEYDPGVLFVLTKNALDVAHIVPLGGDDGDRYWKVSPARLTIVDLTGGK